MNTKRIYNFNENFFETVSSEEQAYVLGLFYSDGYVYSNGKNKRAVFTQIEDRKELVYLVKKLLCAEHPVRKTIVRNKYRYEIHFCSKKLVSDLCLLNCTQNKSLTLQFPNFISDELMPHFIRGLFDGDGCIWNGKRKKAIVKDKTCKSGKRERIIHNVKFTYTGNVGFVSALQNYLIFKLGFSKTKLNFSKANNINTPTCSEVCTLEYSGRKNIQKLYNFMYKDAHYFEQTKFNKFNEILCAFDEKSSKDTSLIAGTPEMVISSQALKY